MARRLLSKGKLFFQGERRQNGSVMRTRWQAVGSRRKQGYVGNAASGESPEVGRSKCGLPWPGIHLAGITSAPALSCSTGDWSSQPPGTSLGTLLPLCFWGSWCLSCGFCLHEVLEYVADRLRIPVYLSINEFKTKKCSLWHWNLHEDGISPRSGKWRGGTGEILPHRTQQVMLETRTTWDPNTSLATACRKTSWLSSRGFVHLLVCLVGFFSFQVCRYVCVCFLYEKVIRKTQQNNEVCFTFKQFLLYLLNAVWFSSPSSSVIKHSWVPTLFCKSEQEIQLGPQSAIRT